VSDNGMLPPRGVDMNVMDFFSVQAVPVNTEPAQATDRNKKIRLVLLACHLLAAKMGMRGQLTPLRITTESLASSYFDESASATIGGAKKMADRDMHAIRQTFGLDGSETAGHALGMSFQPPRAYLQMFKYWLDWQQHQSQSCDTVLAVMLEGLIAAIEGAFTDDPICIPALSNALQKKYAKSNIRDTKRPLRQLFDDRAMAHYLPLETVSEEVDSYKVDVRSEPLLLRKHSRAEVGDNIDDTVVIARPGLIRSQAHAIIRREPEEKQHRLSRMMDAVEHMEIWHTENKDTVIPYSVHYQQLHREFVLVIYRENTGNYQDIPTQFVGELPSASEVMHYCPAGLNQELWQQWKSLSYWQL
ncbi:MAG: hypothetical protein R8L58_05980, partial [Mariprofundaceae bacterium]